MAECMCKAVDWEAYIWEVNICYFAIEIPFYKVLTFLVPFAGQLLKKTGSYKSNEEGNALMFVDFLIFCFVGLFF